MTAAFGRQFFYARIQFKVVFLTRLLYNIINTIGSDNLKKKKIIIPLLVLSLLVPTWYINNFSIKLTEQTIYSEKVDSDIKIAVISDLHGDDNSKTASLIAEQNPDLIFVLGDMYTQYRYEQIDTAIRLIEALSKVAETYVITGEHDTDQSYTDKLNLLENVHLMNYKKDDLSINGTEISIYGIDNVYFSSTFDLHNEFEEPDQDRLNILLSHIPETEDFADFGVDIVFSGDTHGGMIRLPFVGPLYYNGYVLPKLTYPERMTDKGLFSFDNKQIFVTSGIGNYPVPLRFLNRPEVCMITLKKETAK